MSLVQLVVHQCVVAFEANVGVHWLVTLLTKEVCLMPSSCHFSVTAHNAIWS